MMLAPPAPSSSLSRLKAAVEALFAVLEAREPDTAAHSRRVAALAARLAYRLPSYHDRTYLQMGALLHDLGKLAIPESILHKPGPLTQDERAIMHLHEAAGTQLVQETLHDPLLTQIVQYHHAHFSGTPDDPGLPTGHHIPQICRILLIADAYDALTSHRVYRPGTTHEAACAELLRCAGTQFDPDLVHAFIRSFRPHAHFTSARFSPLRLTTRRAAPAGQPSL